MKRALSPGARIALVLVAVGMPIAALFLTSLIPPVQGLGGKVRLPMFHGGSTWVNIAAFTLMGLLALGYLLFSGEDLYRWAAGFRIVAAPLWLLNSVLGVIAAARTWDFSGSSTTPLTVIRDDPRLMAQFQLLMLLIAVIAIDALLHNRKVRALADVVFTAAMWWMLAGIFLDPRARALHPDSPVLNSGSDIQLPFFGIVACLAIGVCAIVWLWRDHLLRTE